MATEYNRNTEKEKFMAQVPGKAIAFFSGKFTGSVPDKEITAGGVFPVKYLDRTGEYYLVPLFQGNGLIGIVQLEQNDLMVESCARIKDPESTFIINAEEALMIAGKSFPEIKDFKEPFLGWRPCRESFNSLFPLWVFPHSNGMIYITQTGVATGELSTDVKG